MHLLSHNYKKRLTIIKSKIIIKNYKIKSKTSLIEYCKPILQHNTFYSMVLYKICRSSSTFGINDPSATKAVLCRNVSGSSC